MTKLLSQNKKMKKSGQRVFNFGIPALKTCSKALACASDCYARQGAYAWSNVQQAYERRYEASLRSNFPELLINEVMRMRKKPTHIRIHDSGDFYSKEYVMKWFKIIRDMPEITFYAYTKEVALFKSIEKYMPENFTIIYSYGGKEDHLIDKENDRHAMVFETKEEMPENYINASDNDLLAISENKRVGLVYHGQKKMKGFKEVSKQTDLRSKGVRSV